MSEPNPSAALLEALDGLSGQAFALFTPDRRLCQASQSFQEKLAGLSRTSQAGADLGDVLGAFASDIGLGDDALATLTADITRRLSGPDATPIDLEQGDDAFRLQVSRCADGSFLLLISDLSELRRNERQYRSIIDQQTEYVSRHDCGFNLTFANRVYLEAFSPDGTIEPLRGKSILVYQEDSARQEAFARNLRSLTPESSVTHDLLRERVADGGLRWQLWINRALFDEEQQLLGYQAVGRDVTEEVESKNALTAIIDGALDGIVEFDQRWRVINANPAARRLFIWSDRDVERSIDPKIAVDEGRGKTTEPLSIYLLRHIKEILGRRIELVAIRTDGKVVPLELALVDAGSEDAHRYVAFLRDLSESRRVQAELEQQRATVAQSEKLSALGPLLAD
ncbi:MAG: PAS domain S-box protein, partial [bacterium]|nr:PAS domain S-box protein [bacterium]